MTLPPRSHLHLHSAATSCPAAPAPHRVDRDRGPRPSPNGGDDGGREGGRLHLDAAGRACAGEGRPPPSGRRRPCSCGGGGRLHLAPAGRVHAEELSPSPVPRRPLHPQMLSVGCPLLLKLYSHLVVFESETAYFHHQRPNPQRHRCYTPLYTSTSSASRLLNMNTSSLILLQDGALYVHELMGVFTM